MLLDYISRFRGIAILFVILPHSIRLLDWNDASLLFAVMRSFFFEASVLFVFISGYLFDHLKSRYTFSRYFSSKAKNILLPYLLVSIPAILIYLLNYKTDHLWILTPEFNELPWYRQTIAFYLTGAHLGPLWYIPVVLLLFGVSPLLLWLQQRDCLVYLVPVCLVLSLVIIKPVNNSSSIHAFLHYLSVYIIGMLASDKKDRLNPVLAKSGVRHILIVAYLVFLALSVTGINQFLFIQKIVLCFLIISILINRGPSVVTRTLEWFGALSFGIYFLHGYIVGFFYAIKNMFEIEFYGGYFILPMAFLVIATSALTVVLIKRILGSFSRYVIGS